MKQQKSLSFNLVLNILLRISSYLFPVITFPYVSRILSPAGMGKVSFIMSVVNYFVMAAQLGLPVYGIQACAKVRTDKEKLSRTVHELLMLSAVTTILAYLILGITVFLVPKLYEEKSLVLLMSSAILLKSIGVEWLYRALEEYGYITARSFVFQIIAVFAVFLLVHGREDYMVYGALLVFAGQASGILNFCHIRRFIQIRPVGNYHIGRHCKAVLLLFAMSCAAMIYTNLDTTMLGMLRTDAETGYYNVAVNVKMVLANIITTLGTVLLPRTSWYYEQGMYEKFYKTAGEAVHAIFLFASPVITYFVLFAEESVQLLSGKEYAAAVLPMQIIMPAILAIGLTNIMGIQMLVPMGKEKYTLYSTLAGAIANLFLNALLIPAWGAAGAAAGTLGAEFVVWIVQYYYIRKQTKGLYRGIRYGMITIVCCFSGIAAYFVKWLAMSTVFTLLVSAVVFFAVYVGLLLWMREPFVIAVFNKCREKAGIGRDDK